MGKERAMCVIGGANIDICGRGVEALKQHDSNPGHISVSLGGVGRNIAEAIALLGAPVEFVTCFSLDSFGKMLRDDCIAMGMDVSHCRMSYDLPTSMYLALLDKDGDMNIAMSDMRLLEGLDESIFSQVCHKYGNDDIIIVDANLREKDIHYVASHATSVIACDPVSIAKCGKLQGVLGRLGMFKPNRVEAMAMSGIEIIDEKSACECIEWFVSRGVGEIVISLSGDGALLGAQGKKYWLRHRKVDLLNATGGGDALLGVYAYMRMRECSPLESVETGMTAAVMAIEKDSLRSRTLTMEGLNAYRETMKIEVMEI